MDHPIALQQALEVGMRQHPNSNSHRHSAFANSVAYLVSGFSGGYGGPSIREHAVSWALTGDGDRVGNIQIPDGRIKRAGEWNFEEACSFAEPIVYGILPAIAAQIIKTEYCFDDDPEDIAALKKP
jgi:hypothetical protein